MGINTYIAGYMIFNVIGRETKIPVLEAIFIFKPEGFINTVSIVVALYEVLQYTPSNVPWGPLPGM